ncbi:MAG: hypothetical protein ABH822_02700 [Patescibacteria group bacterium]
MLLLSMLFFLLFHPSFSLIKYKSIADYWQIISDFESVTTMIIYSVEYRGLKGALLHYCQSGYVEEMLYRGPILLFAIIIAAQSMWEKTLVWPLALFTNYLWVNWAHPHYAPLFLAFIFAGGLVNSAFIIHSKNKALGMIAAIILHASFNLIFVSGVYYFYMT